jgi:MFS family permease
VGLERVFVASIVPGIAVFFIRRKVAESPRFQEALERLKRGEVKRDKVSNVTVFRKPYVRDALPAVLYWIGNAFAFWAFYTFIPLYLVKVRQISAPVELTWLATYNVWGIVIPYLASWLSDIWGRRPFAILFAALTLVAVWGMTFVPNGLPLYLAGALVFGFNNATWCISFAHSTELYPTHIRGSGIGTTMTCGRIASIFAPLLFGVLSAKYGIAVAFRLGALAWILTIIGYLLSRETSGVELDELDRTAASATAPPAAAPLPQPSR